MGPIWCVLSALREESDIRKAIDYAKGFYQAKGCFDWGIHEKIAGIEKNEVILVFAGYPPPPEEKEEILRNPFCPECKDVELEVQHYGADDDVLICPKCSGVWKEKIPGELVSFP